MTSAVVQREQALGDRHADRVETLHIGDPVGRGCRGRRQARQGGDELAHGRARRRLQVIGEFAGSGQQPHRRVLCRLVELGPGRAHQVSEHLDRRSLGQDVIGWFAIARGGHVITFLRSIGGHARREDFHEWCDRERPQPGPRKRWFGMRCRRRRQGRRSPAGGPKDRCRLSLQPSHLRGRSALVLAAIELSGALQTPGDHPRGPARDLVGVGGGVQR